MNVGLQTYTVRKSMQKDLAKTLTTLYESGITCFELARIKFTEENAKVISRLQSKYSMKIVCMQIKFNTIIKNFDSIVDFAKQVKCFDVCVSVLPTKCILGGVESLKVFCEQMNQLSKRFKNNNINLSFHHHNFEFVKVDGQRKIDVLFSHFSKDIGFVTDTYWTAKSGYQADEQIEYFAGRLTGVHLRDIKVYQKGISIKTMDTEVGNGSINFAKVLSASLKAEAKYVAIEQNSSEPFISVKTSLSNINKIL